MRGSVREVFKRNLAHLRKEAGISLGTLADEINLSASGVDKIAAGSAIKIDTVEVIASVLSDHLGRPVGVSDMFDPELTVRGSNSRYVYVYINPAWPKLVVKLLVDDRFIERHGLTQAQVEMLSLYLSSPAVDFTQIDESVLMQYLRIEES